ATDALDTCEIDLGAHEIPRVTMGKRELVLKGEDRMDTRQTSIEGEDVHLAMVADGHGGYKAAELCEQKLMTYFLEFATSPDAKCLRSACRKTFLKLHDEVLAITPPTTAGTTLTLVIVNPKRREITCAHAGDSVAVMVPLTGKMVVSELCEDHRIDSSTTERARLKSMGGRIAHAKDAFGQPGGPLRLWPGGVAQARTIGDSDIGEYNDPRPYVATYPFPESHFFDIVVCSDGVWDALLRNSVGAICRKSGSCTAEVAARLIVNSSLQQRHAYDNQVTDELHLAAQHGVATSLRAPCFT
ncbi:MAG: hypothetical protein SGPRY_005515, partial [Prymnesium sp.]